MKDRKFKSTVGEPFPFHVEERQKSKNSDSRRNLSLVHKESVVAQKPGSPLSAASNDPDLSEVSFISVLLTNV